MVENNIGYDVNYMSSMLNGAILSFIAEEVPDTQDPIFSWYRRYYFKRRQGYAPYGEPIARFLDSRRGQFDRISEIGPGIGQTCIQFAAHGWKTVAVENGRAQYELMLRLLDRVKAIAPEVAARVEPRGHGYPSHVEEYFDNRTLGCFFSLCSSGADDDLMIAPLGLLGGMIVEIRAFFRPREPEEQEVLVKKIMDLGFDTPVPIWNSDADPDFFGLRLFYFEKKR